MFITSPALLLSAVCMTLGFAALAGGAAKDAIPVKIHLNKLEQKITGFGASGGWWAPTVGQWPAEERAALLRMLYTDQGAGLTIYRYHIGADGGPEIQDPWRRAECFEVAPGKYDFSREAGGTQVLRDVVALGVDRVVFFSCSPPVRMTRNGLASGGENGGSNLKPDCINDFAAFLWDVTLHWQKELNIKHMTLSPLNEPQWRWGDKWRGQEACHMNPGEVVEVLRAVLREKEKRQAGVAIEAPEGGAWAESTLLYLKAMLADRSIRAGLAGDNGIAIHSYWSGDGHRKTTRELLDQLAPELAVAQTEWCQMEHKRQVDSIADALVLAQTVHSDLTLARVRSWSFWLAVSKHDYKDGLLYIDDARTVTPSKRFWALTHFSRFIKPGATRVQVETPTDAPGVKAVAFRSAADDQLIVVLINPRDVAVTLQLEVSGAGVGAAKACYVTEAQRDLAALPAQSLDAITLPAQSIMTLLYPLQP